jgi:hypothetical protein
MGRPAGSVGRSGERQRERDSERLGHIGGDPNDVDSLGLGIEQRNAGGAAGERDPADVRSA